MDTKSDLVRHLTEMGDYKAALRIAKGFRLGISKQDIKDMELGYECLVHPKSYQALGIDPRISAKKGVDTLKRLYGT